MASISRLGSGAAVGKFGRRPTQTLMLYEFENCAFCRLVREALTALDLEAQIYPCPKGGQRFRPEAIRRGGKAQFPFLIDPNTGRELYESMDIVEYLFREYGDGSVPAQLALRPLAQLGSSLASALRLPRGLGGAVPSVAAAQPLELWSFEASPYCRIVRESLCELELPYLLHNVGKHSPSRTALVARAGKLQVPYLVDSNQRRELFESADIVRYLHDTYGVPARG